MTLLEMKSDDMVCFRMTVFLNNSHRKKTPIKAVDFIYRFNAENLHSNLVKQDVLKRTGRKIIFFKVHDMQVKALATARPVTDRLFARKEHAQNHSQIENIGLPLQVMVTWIEEKS